MAAPMPPVPAAPPPCEWPRTTTTNAILLLLSLQAVVCLTDPADYPSPLATVLHALQTWLLRLFRTRDSLRIFFFCTLLVHLLEGLYALVLIRRALRHRFGGATSFLWALQTFVVGFPSLMLLMRKLADMDRQRSAIN